MQVAEAAGSPPVVEEKEVTVLQDQNPLPAAQPEATKDPKTFEPRLGSS